ncbi:MAG: MRP family ATP-binding protein [Phycisphaerales bacterium]|nr:MRP family ATP-binding protein [Phycisphaerales bacterium]
MPLTDQDLIEALRTVPDPDLGKDLVTLGMVPHAKLQGDTAHITIELTTPACPMKDRIKADVEAAVRAAASSKGVTGVRTELTFTARVRARPDSGHGVDGASAPAGIPGVKHVIAVGAGKGGVGKSTVSVTLAVGLARMGASVGLLDGDVYGPSMPTMLGLESLGAQLRGQTLLPFEVHGIRAVTIGKLVDPDQALVWRGPRAQGAFKQLATMTQWGELDYLLVDLPPGTGDVPLTLAQMLPLSGAVIVCTPQRVAQDDARRAVRMFQELRVEVLGVVENMSYFVGDDGKEYDLFGRGGAETMAGSMGLPFLGRIPITTALRHNCDGGTPLRNWDDRQLAQCLDSMCQRVAAQISIATLAGRLEQPTLKVS